MPNRAQRGARPDGKAKLDQPSFSGEIVVASRIVDYLSSGLYESPAACLKELINNSYDADALNVNVFVKPDADRIIIEDNGIGMTKADFLKHFTRISESHKRDDSEKTPRGRPKIGKIGIGFIAANEICDIMELFSTKEGSKELLHVSINFDVMRASTQGRRRGNEDFAKADYEGEILQAKEHEHYTVLFLKRVRGDARAILAGAARGNRASGAVSLYGLEPDRIQRILQTPEIRSWSELDTYSQNMLRVGLNVPVSYYDGWLPEKLMSFTKTYAKRAAGLQFHVSIDGTDLRKPIVFNPPGNAFIDKFEFKGKSVSASGYFYVQHGAIRPQELQGLLIRIRNAAIGTYDQTFLDFSSSEGPLFQSWVSGELWADDRLEDAMNIDRKTLRIAHPAYVELQAAVHQHLSVLLKRARSELYGEGSKQRNQDRAKSVVTALEKIADSASSTIGSSAAAEMGRTWTKVGKSPSKQKSLLRKYGVAEFYQIVLEVAAEVLTPIQARAFIKRLTERLGR